MLVRAEVSSFLITYGSYTFYLHLLKYGDQVLPSYTDSLARPGMYYLQLKRLRVRGLQAPSLYPKERNNKLQEEVNLYAAV